MPRSQRLAVYGQWDVKLYRSDAGMSVRNLDALFEPKVIALVGASNREHSVGTVVSRNLLGAGFDGPVLSVNPHEAAIRSTLSYRSVADLPLAPDLAVLATPPGTVPGLVADLAARGCRAAVILTAGFGEGDREAGMALRQATLNAARPNLTRIVGPNCLGVISTPRRVNASFAAAMPASGDIAFVTQSGAIAASLLDWAAGNGLGFSHVVSLGDMADVDFGDLLDYLALDRRTRAILLYVESIASARKFMSAARIAARAKPVIVVKSGRKTEAARAARSHTGALAGSDLVYDAAFRRAGILRVAELRELFQALVSISFATRPSGSRLAILTNGGGAGVIAVDALEGEGGRLATLSPSTLAALNTALPEAWSQANPVDMLGDARGERYSHALAAVLNEPDKDAILVINCPTAVADSDEAAKVVAELADANRAVPIFTCWLGQSSAVMPRRRFADRKIPTYETPEEAVNAFMHLVRYSRNQELLMETPVARDAARIDRRSISEVLETAKLQHRSLLTEVESKAVLTACGVPVVTSRPAATPVEAGKAAVAIGGRVALKVLSPDIAHKSDVGGVRLGLSPEFVSSAAEEMLRAVRARAPAARIDGFTIAAMIDRPHARELLLGIARDATFGPVVLFGQGGTAAEILADRAIGLPPLNSALAKELMGRARAVRLLEAYRDRPAAEPTAIEDVLIRLSQLALEFPEIGELDINPLLADEAGVIALDARIVIAEPTAFVQSAIAPYPEELAQTIRVDALGEVLLRPIRPEDEPLLVDMLRRSEPSDVRMRFLAPLHDFPHAMAARLCQIDYDREMAIIAMGGDASPKDLIGVVRLVGDPENENAEFAVIVRSDVKGRGLGYALMQTMIGYARKRGLRCMHGDVFSENETMIAMARELGFSVTPTSARGVVRVALVLREILPPVA